MCDKKRSNLIGNKLIGDFYSKVNRKMVFNESNCLLFKLSYTYLMNNDAFLASEYVSKYSKPLIYDYVALAIAKMSNIVLLIGD